MVTINVVPFDRSNVSPFGVEVEYNDQGNDSFYTASRAAGSALSNPKA
jgi:hypothetical protein